MRPQSANITPAATNINPDNLSGMVYLLTAFLQTRNNLDVESEENDVAVLEHIFLAFASYKALFLCNYH